MSPLRRDDFLPFFLRLFMCTSRLPIRSLSPISKGIGGALLGFPERYPSPYSATYATARSPKDLPAGVPLHHLRRYQSFSFRYTVPATNKQMAFPPNNTTARSTEESIHLSWLACLRHLRYDIPNMFHIKLHVHMAHYPACPVASGYLLPTYATGWPNRIYLDTGTCFISMGTNGRDWA